MGLTIAIHQPNFLPWLGFFQKISAADVVVYLDHVQASTGKSWLTRNRIMTPAGPQWLTIPISRSGKSRQAIDGVMIADPDRAISKMAKRLAHNYAAAPHYENLAPLIMNALECHWSTLAPFNKRLIQILMGYMGLHSNFVSSRSIVDENPQLNDLAGNGLIVALCAALGADRYLSGRGCESFIRPDTFRARGIEFFFVDTVEVPYLERPGNFVPRLSFIDALFNCPREEALQRLGSFLLRQE